MVLTTRGTAGNGSINMERLAEKLQEQHIKKAEILVNKAEKRDNKLIYTPTVIVDRLKNMGVKFDYVKKFSPKLYAFIESEIAVKEVAKETPEKIEAPKAESDKQPQKKKDKAIKSED